MKTIYTNQDLLTISIDTEIDLSAATTLRVYYEKPNGATGFWVGSLSGTDKIEYDVITGDFDQVGTWVLQGFATIGGQSAYGTKFRVRVEAPIT